MLFSLAHYYCLLYKPLCFCRTFNPTTFLFFDLSRYFTIHISCFLSTFEIYKNSWVAFPKYKLM